MEKFAKTEKKLKRKNAVENKTETEKYFRTEITLTHNTIRQHCFQQKTTA